MKVYLSFNYLRVFWQKPQFHLLNLVLLKQHFGYNADIVQGMFHDTKYILCKQMSETLFCDWEMLLERQWKVLSLMVKTEVAKNMFYCAFSLSFCSASPKAARFEKTCVQHICQNFSNWVYIYHELNSYSSSQHSLLESTNSWKLGWLANKVVLAQEFLFICQRRSFVPSHSTGRPN